MTDGTIRVTARQVASAAAALAQLSDAAGRTAQTVRAAARETQKYLASFDTIERLRVREAAQSASASTSARKNPAATPATPAAPRTPGEGWNVSGGDWNALPAIQAARDALAGLGALLDALAGRFRAVWADGPSLLAPLRAMLEEVSAALGQIGATFRAVWSDGTGEQVLRLLAALLTTLCGIVRDIAAAFRAAWDSQGEETVRALCFALSSALALLTQIGEAFRAAWNTGAGEQILATLLDALTNLYTLAGNLGVRLREAWDAGGNGTAIWRALLGLVQDVASLLDRMAAATANWAASLHLEPAVAGVRSLLEALEPLARLILDGLAWAYERVLLPLGKWVIEDAAPAAVRAFGDALDGLMPLLRALGGLFEAVWPLIQPIASLFGGILVGAVQMLGRALEAAGKILAWFVELLTTLLELLRGHSTLSTTARTVLDAMEQRGQTVPARLGGMESTALGRLPHLAAGAAIPPNSAFLAVLGDQTGGYNYEVPDARLRALFRDEFARSGAGGGRNITITFDGSLSELARVLHPHIRTEGARLGANLIEGGAMA